MTQKPAPKKRRKPNPPPAITLQRGRPAVYEDAFCEHARRLCLLGMIDDEIAEFFGVARATLGLWDRQHPAFKAARARGREHADGRVAEKLYHRSLGYSHESVKIFLPPGATEPVYAKFVEHYPPDTTAASLWLRNRQPGKWKDKPGSDGSDDAANTITIIGGLPE